MRMKVARVEVVRTVGKDEGQGASDGWRDVLIRKRPARARALPDAAVAVSLCGLAVWSFT